MSARAMVTNGSIQNITPSNEKNRIEVLIASKIAVTNCR